MDKNYIIHFDNETSADITETELLGLGNNLDKPDTQNFQWFKRPEGWFVVALDKVVSIEPKKMTGDAIVTPVKPDTIKREREEAFAAGISSADAVLEKFKNNEEA